MAREQEAGRMLFELFPKEHRQDKLAKLVVRMLAGGYLTQQIESDQAAAFALEMGDNYRSGLFDDPVLVDKMVQQLEKGLGQA